MVSALVREDCGLLRSTMLACGRRERHTAHAKRETPSRRIGSILADPPSVRFLLPSNVTRRRFEAAGLASSGCATRSLSIVRSGYLEVFRFKLGSELPVETSRLRLRLPGSFLLELRSTLRKLDLL